MTTGPLPEIKETEISTEPDKLPSAAGLAHVLARNFGLLDSERRDAARRLADFQYDTLLAAYRTLLDLGDLAAASVLFHLAKEAAEAEMSTEQIKYMVDRFLQWRLPENFNPDGGISFKRTFNENTSWPMKNEPVGTNLFDAVQAEAMVRYMIDGMPQEAGRDGGNPTLPEADREYYEAKGRREENNMTVDVKKWEQLIHNSQELKQAGEELAAALMRYNAIAARIAVEAGAGGAAEAGPQPREARG